MSVKFPDGRSAFVSFGIESSDKDVIGGINIKYADGGSISIGNGFDQDNKYDGKSTSIKTSGMFPSARQAVSDATMILRTPELIRGYAAGGAGRYNADQMNQSAENFAGMIESNYRLNRTPTQQPAMSP